LSLLASDNYKVRRGIGLSGLLIALTVAACGGSDVGDIPTTSHPLATTVTTSDEMTSTTNQGPQDAPRLFDAASPAGIYRMTVGETSALRLGPDAETPRVEGKSVLLIEVAFLDDPGYKEWELRAVAPGETAITIFGPAGESTFEFVVVN
jgi:hypothetical protein